MRYKRVLLLNPPYRGRRVRVVFCAGLGYIAQSLEAAGIEHDLLDMSLGYVWSDLKRKIEAFAPDLIGISLMTYRYKESYQLLTKIKKNYPKITIVVGGPHISLFRDQVLKDCPAMDFAVVLEGEQTIVELCQGKSVETIKGLIFKADNNIVYNGDREFVSDLDAIAFPRYEKFELEKSLNKETTALPIVSSRGCPFECVYCPVNSSIGRNFRARTPADIIKELTYWHQKGWRRFSFADDNFTLLKERVKDLCHLLQESNLRDIKLSCDNGIRADQVDKDLLRLMRQVGFYRLALGVEAGNDRILNNLKKQEKIATIKQVIEDGLGLGYDINLFFLVGSPGETSQDVEDSFNIALSYPIGIAFFYNIIPFPHTELFSWIESNGRFLSSPDEYLNDYPILDNRPVFETRDMPEKERKRVLRRAFAITRITMRRSWQRRLSSLGFLGKTLAFLYTAKVTQDIILRKKILRALVYKIAQILLRGKDANFDSNSL